ncbi:hypothetical protein [Mesorhizobium sp. YM1C-6-2]|jgi:hypothetical protein|uniref:hypothetical protein n=1 Tax=Mesorhizobium sp. YM1C-6-2 TaxID=1827501 RepID=UPI000EF265E2|nr:hypothetical protein [Mesorhizobium sp. YM1C-6-2]RLP27066.1 hypothetical protein D8676_07685 [Mesorhizobium sp. YM1C-6-2]
MASFFSKKWLYRLASTLILGGFAMLCQPFTHALFVLGFPVLLAGVVVFMILDHVPDGRIEEDKNG